MIKRPLFAIISGGLALFSMFFGAGNIVFPLMLGRDYGLNTPFAISGLIVTAVLCPLAALLAMMLFEGDHTRFFGRLGKIPGKIAYFFVQMIVGPIGSIPRLFVVAHAALIPLFPQLNLGWFSVIGCAVCFAFAFRKTAIIGILGLVLTPLLIILLCLITTVGLSGPPAYAATTASPILSAFDGLKVGYGMLDFLAALLFAKLIISSCLPKGEKGPNTRKKLIARFLPISLIAAGLLALTYLGLSLMAARHALQLEAIHPENILISLSTMLLGSYGGIIAGLAVALACLTTAISLASVFADYLHRDLLSKGIPEKICLIGVLILSALLANLGLAGIMKMLYPLLLLSSPVFLALVAINLLIPQKQLVSKTTVEIT